MIDERIDYARRWKRFGLPVRYQGLRLTDSDMLPANREALLTAKHFADTFTERYVPTASGEHPELLGKGLLLGGNPGTGKTRIACATATEAHYSSNYTVLFIPVTNYFALGREQQKFMNIAEKFRDEESLAKVKRLQERLDLVLTAPLLILDDMGKEYAAASGWVGTEVHRILRTRFDKGRPTIATSNLPLEEWQRYDGAMYSFLREAFDIANIGGQDWRRAGK